MLRARTWIAASVLCAAATTAALAAPRTWRDNSGKFSVEAELVEVTGESIVLKRADGSTIKVSIARLSADDRKYLDALDSDESGGDEAVADEQLSDALSGELEEWDVPALAGAIVTSDGLEVMGVAGVRKRGTKAPATASDVWHLGSNTKAMTATLIARLVEQEKLTLETTIGEVFADGDAKIHPDFQSVTISQLLAHRAGLPPNLNLAEYLGTNGRQLRQRAVEKELSAPPQTEPGSAFEYSNLGYLIAGAMVEKLTGASWQENIVRLVFDPLEMHSVGFGGTGTRGKLDQPWGHIADGQPVGQNGPAVDNPPVMGPAGRVHCTMADWAKYVADMLRGLQGEPALLPADSYQALTIPPPDGDYALGWVVTQRDWGGGTVLLHNGSNTMNYATVWIAPNRDVAFLACTNQGGEAAQQACNAAVVALLAHHSAMAEEAAPAR